MELETPFSDNKIYNQGHVVLSTDNEDWMKFVAILFRAGFEIGVRPHVNDYDKVVIVYKAPF